MKKEETPQETPQTVPTIEGLEDFNWDGIGDEPPIRNIVPEDDEKTPPVETPPVNDEDDDEEPTEPTEKTKTPKPKGTPADPPVEPTPEDDEYARNLFENFKELGFISDKVELKEDELFTQEKLIELMEEDKRVAIEEGVNAALDEFIGEVGEEERLALTYMKKGGKIKDFVNLYSENPMKLDGDITNEAYQDEIIAYYEKTYNQATEEEVKDILETFSLSGKKEIRAKNYLKNLNNKFKEDQERTLQAQNEAIVKRQKDEKADLEAIKTSLNQIKDVKSRNTLFSYLTDKSVELQNGRKISQFNYDISQVIGNPEKRVILAKLLQTGFDMSKIERQVETQVTRKFKDNLLKEKPTRQKRTELSWEDFKS